MCIFYSRVNFAVCKGTCGESYMYSAVLTWLHFWIYIEPTPWWIIFFPFFLVFMSIALPFTILDDAVRMLFWALTFGCCFQCRPGLWARRHTAFGIGDTTEWEPFADKCCCCGNSCIDYCREVKRLRAEGTAAV